jgi:HEAT repeats
MRTRIHWPVLFLALFLFANRTPGQMIISDDRSFKDAAERGRIEEATKGMNVGDRNLGSLETLLSFFGEDQVFVKGFGIVIYQNPEKSIQAAHDALTGPSSMSLFQNALAAGSEPAARWALHKLISHMVISPPKDAVSNAPAPEARRFETLTDEVVRREIQGPVLSAEKTRSAPTRALALNAVAELRLVEDVPGLLKERLHEPDENVAAVAVWKLTDIRNVHVAGSIRDPDTDALVWQLLEKATTEDLKAACCQYVWVVDPGAIDSHVGIINRLSTDSSPQVRAMLARAISVRDTRPQDWLETTLLRLADDKDGRVRGEAISGLSLVDPAGSKAILLQHFDPKESSSVRLAALSALGSAGPGNADIVLAASKDADPNIRAASAMWLRRIKSPATVAALDTLTKDPNQNVRQQATIQLDWVRKETGSKNP